MLWKNRNAKSNLFSMLLHRFSVIGFGKSSIILKKEKIFKPETRNQKLETSNQKTETLNPEPRTVFLSSKHF
jgi:hypothetical protein